MHTREKIVAKHLLESLLPVRVSKAMVPFGSLVFVGSMKPTGVPMLEWAKPSTLKKPPSSSMLAILANALAIFSRVSISGSASKCFSASSIIPQPCKKYDCVTGPNTFTQHEAKFSD